jgi:hypothetical protein
MDMSIKHFSTTPTGVRVTPRDVQGFERKRKETGPITAFLQMKRTTLKY